jgi:hypothetical protein
MRRIKTSKTKIDRKRKEWPLVVYVWAAGLGIFGYAVARISLDSYPHPLHWGSGIVGGLLGVLVGWAWYRWRGDILW